MKPVTGYLIAVDKDDHRKDGKHYWVLYRVVEGTPEYIYQGTLAAAAKYLYRAWRKTQKTLPGKRKRA